MDRIFKPDSLLTRRTFLASMAAPLGYLGYRVAAHNQWIIVTRGRRPFNVGVQPKPINRDGQFSMLVVGDTGKDTSRRAQGERI